LSINGVDKTAKITKRTLRFDWTRGGRATLKFDICDVNRSTGYMANLDEVVILVVDSVTLFRGQIVERDNAPIGGIAGGTRCSIVCADASLVLDRITVTADYTGSSVPIVIATIANPTHIQTSSPHGFISGENVRITGMAGGTPNPNGDFVCTVLDSTHFTVPVNVTAASGGGQVRQILTLKEVVTDLTANYLTTNYGIHLDAGMLSGPVLDPIAWDGSTFTDVLGDLEKMTGRINRVIDVSGVKTLQVFALGEKTATFGLDGSNTNTPVQWQQTRQQFTNRVIVAIGGTQQITRVQNFASTGSAGNYTVDYPASLSIADLWPNELIIDGVNNGPVSWNDGGSLFQWYWDPINHRLVDKGGAATPTAGHVITVAYSAQYPVSCIAQDATDVQPPPTGRGPWEARYEVPGVTEIAQGNAIAANLLAQQFTSPRALQIATIAGFSYPGDQMTLNFPDRQVSSGSWIVESVGFSLWGPALLYYEYTFTEGSAVVPTWINSIQELLGGGTSSAASGTTAIGGSITVVTGGTFLSSPASLGGSDQTMIVASSFTRVPNAIPYVAPASMVVTVRGVVVAHNSVSVTLQIYDETSSSVLATGSAVAATSAPTNYTAFTCTMVAGHRYILRVQGPSGEFVSGLATVET
jgi:hypothetical protein